MRKKIFLFAIIIVCITNNSFSTPAYDYNSSSDEPLFLRLHMNDGIRPLHFDFNDYASVSFENIYSSPKTSIKNNETLVFSSIWNPSWNQNSNRRSPDWSNFNRRYEKHPHSKRWKDEHKPNPVPEPATILLFGSGLIGLAFISRTVKKSLKATDFFSYCCSREPGKTGSLG